MKYEKGKKITNLHQFKKGRKYTGAFAYEVFEFSHIGENGNAYFKNEGQPYIPSQRENNCIGFNFNHWDFYEAIELTDTLDAQIGKEYEFSDDGERWTQPMRLVAVVRRERKYIADLDLDDAIDYKYIREIKQKVMEKLTDKEHKLLMQLFVGKVADIIGFDKCTELIRECKRDLPFGNKKTFQERLEEKKQEKK